MFIHHSCTRWCWTDDHRVFDEKHVIGRQKSNLSVINIFIRKGVQDKTQDAIFAHPFYIFFMKRLLFLLSLLFVAWSTQAQERLKLLFVGDLMQHQAQIDSARTADGFDYSDCFKHIKETISQADIAIANLEVTLGGKPYRGYPAFSAPDDFLYAIQDAGFDVLLTGNNHCLDRGTKGLVRTIQLLDSLQIPHTGTFVNAETRENEYPLLIEKNGFRIVFLNYTYDTNGLRPQKPTVVNYIQKEEIKKDILKARRMRPDVIIACMHWGLEYRSLPDKAERDLAEWLLTQGVDHIICSHPHVIQPIEVRQNKKTPARHLIAYSLGNFISNMSQIKTDGGLILEMELQRIAGITRLLDCQYKLVWTSRPVLSGKKNFEVYPADFSTKSINNQELNCMNRFLNDSRKLMQKHNIGIKEEKR